MISIRKYSQKRKQTLVFLLEHVRALIALAADKKPKCGNTKTAASESRGSLAMRKRIVRARDLLSEIIPDAASWCVRYARREMRAQVAWSAVQQKKSE